MDSKQFWVQKPWQFELAVLDLQKRR